MLRAGIMLSVDPAPQIVAITSASASEGKTTTSAGLALANAAAGLSTILIEADFVKPTLSNVFGVPADAPSMLDMLSDRTTVPDTYQTSSGLHVLPATSGMSGKIKLTHGTSFDEMFKTLRGEFDIIVVDTAPATMVSDSLLVASRCDGVVVVLTAHHTNKGAHRRLRKLLRQSNISTIGTVLNRAVEKRNAYYYSYSAS